MFAGRKTSRRRRSLRHTLWPKRGWRRAVSYYWKRLVRLSATPHAIAAGGAAGVFAAFSPLLGFHVILSLALAFILRGNLIAAALATMLGNPVTLPFFWGASYELGSWILSAGADPVGGVRPGTAQGVAGLHADFLSAGFEAVWPILKPTLVGSIPLGFVAALIAYAVLHAAVRGMRARRRERRAIAAERRRQLAMSMHAPVAAVEGERP